jgi:hypothetical protein
MFACRIAEALRRLARITPEQLIAGLLLGYALGSVVAEAWAWFTR